MSDHEDTDDSRNTRARIESKLVEWGFAQPGTDAHRYADTLLTLVRSLGEERVRKLKACASDSAFMVERTLGVVQRMQPVVERARELHNTLSDIGAKFEKVGALTVAKYGDNDDEPPLLLDDVAAELHALGEAVNTYNTKIITSKN